VKARRREDARASVEGPPGPSWLKRTATGWTIAVHVQPGAKRSAVGGLHGERLKLRIAAPPIEGRANAAVAEFVAESLGVARARVKIVAGERSRDKLIAVDAPECDPGRLLPSAG
jgi:uncharacterized protein (TIGR00251 family)